MFVLEGFRLRLLLFAWGLIFLLLIPLEDTRPGGAQAAYDHAMQTFQRGDLAKSQREAEMEIWQFQTSNPDWAAKFLLLQAETMVWRGMYSDALRLLADYHPDSNSPEETIHKLAIEASALAHQQQFSAADQRLTQAEGLCKIAHYTSCGYVLRTRGHLAIRQGNPTLARRYYLDTIAFAQTHHDRFLEAGASLNLGFVALQNDRYDEAVDWSRSAYRTASDLSAEGLVQLASGNLGWAYYQLGDDERALEQFNEAETSAARLGNLRGELKWTSDAGYIYQDGGDSTRATQAYRRALNLARQIDSKEDMANLLGDLAQVSVETGKLDEASGYLDQVTPIESAGGNRLIANVKLTQGTLATARRQNQQAETIFRAVQKDTANPTTTRLVAGEQLARLFELQGNKREAERTYKTTLTTFESARAQLKHEDSRLPFAANATDIYDGYIHLLVEEGRSDEALALADQSRARTLAQGLGVAASKASFQPAALNPRQIAQKTGATLLFYWLGKEQSYLWIVNQPKITLIRLPAQREIISRVERYRKVLLNMDDPRQPGNPDGQALYQILVAPAAKLIRPGATVMILDDGALSRLNFETLLAPGPSPQVSPSANHGPNTHYWIDDVTLLSAPSLDLLAAARPARENNRKLLLLGNPVSPSPDYPSLPLFGFEMNKIEGHFAGRNTAVFAGPQATPAAYLASNPAQYAYIHFVSHAVASSTDPLDSAIILSQPKASQDSFKLYARDIMQHPIDARLVTISACYGSGSRSYAGEGLVGLSWAFLRAGAHSVIGALWEVSDDSTPRLMDSLYKDLEVGQAPAVALRNAKLALLHSPGRYNLPFYWGSFQIYTQQ
jgi:CHAT domain-containing protein/tetratricopeptide (TPR) repeat protein